MIRTHAESDPPNAATKLSDKVIMLLTIEKVSMLKLEDIFAISPDLILAKAIDMALNIEEDYLDV